MMSDPEETREWVVRRLRDLLAAAGRSEGGAGELAQRVFAFSEDAALRTFLLAQLGSDHRVHRFATELLRRKATSSLFPPSLAEEHPSAASADAAAAAATTVSRVYVKQKLHDTGPIRQKRKQPQSQSPPPQQETTFQERMQSAAPQQRHSSSSKGPHHHPHSKGSRTPCDCYATRHALLGNCLNCGKIVCAAEGFGPCSFCGENVAPPHQQQQQQKQKHKGKQQQQQASGDGGEDAVTRATKLKEKLLEFDRTSAQRTVIYDDQQDYYSTSREWLSPAEREQREQAERRRQEERERAEEAKRHSALTFEFAGQTVTVTQHAASPTDAASASSVAQQTPPPPPIPMPAMAPAPHLDVARPTYVAVAAAAAAAAAPKKQEPRKMRIVQDDYGVEGETAEDAAAVAAAEDASD